MSGSSLELRPTEPGDLPALGALFARRFGRPLGEAEWVWKYRQLPGQGRSWVAAMGGNLLAHAGALRLPARWPGGEGGIWQLVDWVAAERVPHLRPPLVDLGRTLLADLPAEGDAPWIFGFPSDRHFRLGQRVFGYRPLGEIVPLDGEIAASNRHENVEVRWSDVAPTDSAAIWAESAGGIGVVRSAEFLNWRYHARPDRYYRVYRPEASGVRGLARGLAIVAFAGRVAHLVELWLPPGPDWRPSLLSIQADLGAAGIERWTAWPPRNGRTDLDAALADLGLRPTAERIVLGCRGREGGPDPVAGAAGFLYAMGDYDLV